jgi:hypothetical protein
MAITVIHNRSNAVLTGGRFVEAFSFVRKLLFLRKFNSCIKNDRFVKTFADQVFSALGRILSTELSTG